MKQNLILKRFAYCANSGSIVTYFSKSIILLVFVFFTYTFLLITPSYAQTLILNTPTTNGTVFAVAPDGNNGWYIGGGFTQVGGITRNRLAHILANGIVDSTWDPNVNSNVYTIAVNGSTIYIGGDFTSVSGQARNRLAAINADGTLSTWDPNASGRVLVIKVEPSTLITYIGGEFSQINGVARSKVAAVDTNGSLLNWNPTVVGNVRAIEANSSTVYIGGNFTSVNGQARKDLASIGTDGSLSTLVADTDGLYGSATIETLSLINSTIYVGGSFTSIGGQSRNNLAAISTDGTVLNWNPNSNSVVYSIYNAGQYIYIGGKFTTVGGLTINKLAAISTDGSPLSWDPNVTQSGFDASVRSIWLAGNKLICGGQFNSVGSTNQTNLAFFSLNQSPGTPSISSSTINGTTAGTDGNYIVHEGENLVINFTASDLDSSDTVTLNTPTSPIVGTFSAAPSANPGTATFTFTPTSSHVNNTYNFTARAIDNNNAESSSTISVSISVLGLPPPPTPPPLIQPPPISQPTPSTPASPTPPSPTPPSPTPPSPIPASPTTPQGPKQPSPASEGNAPSTPKPSPQPSISEPEPANNSEEPENLAKPEIDTIIITKKGSTLKFIIIGNNFSDDTTVTLSSMEGLRERLITIKGESVIVALYKIIGKLLEENKEISVFTQSGQVSALINIPKRNGSAVIELGD